MSQFDENTVNTSLIKEHYNDFYSKNDFVSFNKAEKAFIKSLVKKFRLSPGSRVLDLACGTGKYSIILKQQGMNPTGVDISDEGIKIAKTKCPECDFRVMDVLKLDFEKESFDAVLCSGLSLFNTDKLESLRDMMDYFASYIKPGGYFFFLKTSSLTDKMAKSKSRIDYKTSTFRRFLAGTKGLTPVNAGGTYPQVFILLGKCAFSSLISFFSTINTKITGIPVRSFVALKKH